MLVFRPQSEITSKRPGIIYYHGGGWVVMAPSKGYTIISVTSLGLLIKCEYDKEIHNHTCRLIRGTI